MRDAPINRGHGVPSLLQLPCTFFQHRLGLELFSFAFRDRLPDGVAWLFQVLVLEECLRVAGESRRGRAHHPSALVGSAEEHWARGVLLL